MEAHPGDIAHLTVTIFIPPETMEATSQAVEAVSKAIGDQWLHSEPPWTHGMSLMPQSVHIPYNHR